MKVFTPIRIAIALLAIALVLALRFQRDGTTGVHAVDEVVHDLVDVVQRADQLLGLAPSPRAERTARSGWKSAIGATCASDSANALSVLFIGNSHTFVNDLPDMFCRLASRERPMRIMAMVVAGWSLRQHWEDGKAIHAIRERGPWDFVVLQEQSGTPLVAPAQFEDSVKQFDAVARAAGAHTALYELWPRRDAGARGHLPQRVRLLRGTPQEEPRETPGVGRFAA